MDEVKSKMVRGAFNAKAQKGWSVIDILLAATVLGIIGSIAVPAYQNYVEREEGVCQDLQEKYNRAVERGEIDKLLSEQVTDILGGEVKNRPEVLLIEPDGTDYRCRLRLR